MKIVSIGEVLWDVVERNGVTTARLGGAPFLFAVQAHRLGHEVTFVSAVGGDGYGKQALAALRNSGLPTAHIATVNAPTGLVRVTFDAWGEPQYAIARPAAYDFTPPPKLSFEADWLCYGTLLQTNAAARQAVSSVRARRRFYDINLREGQFTNDLVLQLLKASDAVKMNGAEAMFLASLLDWPAQEPPDFLARAAQNFGWEAACVTLGGEGSVVYRADETGYAAAAPVAIASKNADTVGAGDAFSAAFLHGCGLGWPAAEIARFANQTAAAVIGENSNR